MPAYPVPAFLWGNCVRVRTSPRHEIKEVENTYFSYSLQRSKSPSPITIISHLQTDHTRTKSKKRNYRAADPNTPTQIFPGV